MTPTPPPTPPMALSIVGLVALVASLGIDAFAPGWDPEPWTYLVAIVVLVWGPTMIPAIFRGGGK